MSHFFNWQLVLKYFPAVFAKLPVTLMIVGIATVIGLVLGVILAFTRIERVPVLSQIAAVFVSFIRGTPILVQLYVVYYGFPAILQLAGIDTANWNKLYFLYITYGLNTAAFQSETIRAAFLSVPRLQAEASAACGLTKTQMYWHVLIPQAASVAIPTFGTNTISLLQDTSLAFTIGVVDVVGEAKALGSVSFHVLEGYIDAAILFVILSFILSKAFGWLGHKLDFANINVAEKQPSLIAKLLGHLPHHVDPIPESQASPVLMTKQRQNTLNP